MKILGKILWWDKKDLNGVIIDAKGNEYYFDISVLETTRSSSIKPGTVVQFTIQTKYKSSLSAKSVVIPLAKAKGKLEREFEKTLQLSFEI